MRSCFRKLTAMAVAFSVAFLSAACTTMEPIRLHEDASIASQIKSGDTIHCRLESGEVERLKVIAISNGEIQGYSVAKDRRVNNEDVKSIEIRGVKSIEKQRFSTLRTAGVILGMYAFIFVVGTR